MAIDTTAVYVSRPDVLVDGQANAGLSRDLVALLVEEHTDGLFRAEMVLTNFGNTAGGDYGYLYFDRDVIEFGKEVTLRLGPDSPPTTVFVGRITALEAEYIAGGSSRLVMLMEDRLQDLRMTRRTRSFEDSTDAQIIEQVAQGHGLTPQVSLNGPTHKSVAQVNLSDLAFIRERARTCGGELWIEGQTLHVSPRDARGGQPIQLSYGGSLHVFRVRADLAQQCTEFVVSGWDVNGKAAIRESAGASAIGSELAGDEGGGAILEEKFGERLASIVHTVPLTSDEARTVAEARYRERARRFVTGTGQCDGDPRIRVGASLALSGLGPLFDGTYYVARARHTFTLNHGFRTEFDVERPGLGQG